MVVCDLAVIVLWCLVSLGGCELPGLVFYGKRSDTLFTYSTLSPSGIQQCVRACFLDKTCNSVNFDRSQLTCHLNSREVQPDSLTSDSDFVFITNISGSQVRLLGSQVQVVGGTGTCCRELQVHVVRGNRLLRVIS